MASLRLFDDIHRIDTAAKPYAESSFSYLNRSARADYAKVRALMDEWFGRYPETEGRDLRKRFRSVDDEQHRGAYFELFLHELLLRSGCEVKVHPKVGNRGDKRPDFLAIPPNGSPFIVEALVIGNESDFPAKDRKRYGQLVDYLNWKVTSSNYYFGIDMKEPPPATLKPSDVAGFLNRRLAHLDAETAKAGGVSEHLWLEVEWPCPESFNWEARFFPHPKPKNLHGVDNHSELGIQASSLRNSDRGGHIRDKIEKKAGKYGEMEYPYVIAVNILDRGVDDPGVMEALFGDIECILTTDGRTVTRLEDRRKPNGAWSRPGGQKYNRVSAVLVGSPVMMCNLPRSKVRLWHNPWAERKYSSVLCRLPQAVPDEANHQMRFVDGEKMGKLFGLDERWPDD